MKALHTPIMAIMAAAILLIPVGISAFQQQQASAIIGPEYSEFKQTTHDFEKAVIGLIGNPDVTPPDPVVRGLLQTYAEDVSRIFLGGPDTIPVLLGDYQQKVLSLLTAPPEPDREQAKEFRQLTNAFEKALTCVVIQPCI
jgi:hypothetical protein